MRIVLDEDLRIGNAAALYERLCAVAANASVEFDGSAVAKVDGAGLQALAAALVRYRAAGLGWRWNDASQALRQAVRTAGLEAELGLT